MGRNRRRQTLKKKIKKVKRRPSTIFIVFKRDVNRYPKVMAIFHRINTAFNSLHEISKDPFWISYKQEGIIYGKRDPNGNYIWVEKHTVKDFLK
jgi:hypothetical protein